MLRKWWLVFVFLVGLVSVSLFHPTPGFAAEQISNFRSEITVQTDTSIKIQETIVYETDVSKHGIYRYIPTRYTRNGLNYTAKVKNISIADEAGEPIHFQRSSSNGNVVLKIGDADITFTGEKTYVISYTVDNAVQLIKSENGGYPQLYWDITGEGWQFTIASTTAIVKSPNAEITKLMCYSGTFGENDEQCSFELIDQKQAEFWYPQPINYGDNLTVAVDLDATGGVVFPTAFQRFLKGVRDNSLVLLLTLPGSVMLGWWWLRGRDLAFASWNVFNQEADRPQLLTTPWSRQPVPMVYEPIAELTPGEAGGMLNERIDTHDVIAEIIDLARQKYIKIERDEKRKLFGAANYTLTKLREPAVSLPEHQRYLLERLFLSGDTVSLKDLKGKFYTSMANAKDLMNKSLVAKGLFRRNPGTDRAIGLTAAGILTGLAAVVGMPLLSEGQLLVIPSLGFSAAMGFLAAWFLPAKTAIGHNFALQAKGLRASIQRGAWREKISEKHLFFEEVLPFAVALGVVDQLARDMKDLNVKPPEYVPFDTATMFSTNSFIHSFSSQASQSLTYNPSSSSWSSGGGGGSSGGGGGGGGGGSW